MKNFKRGFTLVEMLIVVVIIGILAAALLPRLQGAQAAARDSARKSDISQLGTAVLSYQNNRGYYPEAEGGTGDSAYSGMIHASDVREKLNVVTDLSSMPADPLKGTTFTGIDGTSVISGGQYGYMVLPKNQVDRAGFVLMARTETEGGSNRVHLTGVAAGSTDLTSLKPCTKMEPGSGSNDGNGNCTYENKGQLRYIYTF